MTEVNTSHTNSVVDVDDYRVTSNSESSEDMAKGLKEPESDKEPKIVRGKAEKEKPEKDDKADDDKGDDVSKAASTLGKKSAEAAAKARKEAEKEKTDDKEEKPKPEVEAKAEPEKPEEKPKPKPRDDMQERIRQQSEQLRREREERAAERQRYEERLAAIEARVNGKPAPEAGKDEKAAADADPEPLEENFDLHSEWIREHSKWAARTEGRRAAREEYETRTRQATVFQQATTYTQSVVAHMERFEGRVAEAVKEDPSIADDVDIREIARATTYMLPQGQMPGPINLIANDITASAHGAALAAHLRRNPEDFQRVVEVGKAAYRLGADEQEALLRAEQAIHREMAILEVGISSAKAKPASDPAPEKAEPSRATPPMKPVNASTHTGGEPGDDAPYDDHVEYWNSKEAAARKR